MRARIGRPLRGSCPNSLPLASMRLTVRSFSSTRFLKLPQNCFMTGRQPFSPREMASRSFSRWAVKS